ncbi:N-glycosylation protein-domain-containing protein [Truncatella angustata]|uniref:N-glycosylation protein-domain-containing protein n=1 Tax=Truncatella angustata TaxID=152316 RepID=A0A9P8UGL9_9PEZI|nr:N-glycosylation protein-domain-containing protein [Truncatella angustata]KAH6651771.1 N-glycosylation protein-domain-containing protein [Truncatella angustata]
MAVPSTDDEAASEKQNDSPVVSMSSLRPRVAVVLGIPSVWHYPLFLCRLLSIAPAILWGLRFALRFLITDFLRSEFYRSQLEARGLDDVARIRIVEVAHTDWSETRLRLTETALSLIWCGSSAHLAFIFADCLMSRWLLNYTPQATIIRLLTLCTISGFIAQKVTYLLGADRSPLLLLPAWIGIATTLTVCYHVSQRRINIRKETKSSISIFGIASFISLVALLVNQHMGIPAKRDYPEIPLTAVLGRAAEIGGRVLVTLLGVNGERDGL